MTTREIPLSQTTIETALWLIKASLMKKYGCDAADRIIEPLVWYISTGRASTVFLRKLVNAKPFMVGRRLAAGGSTDEVVARVKEFIKA